jgi:hypothetical protein
VFLFVFEIQIGSQGTKVAIVFKVPNFSAKKIPRQVRDDGGRASRIVGGAKKS